MWCVLFAHILYPEVVDNEGENNGTSVVFPQAWGRLALAIAMLLQAFLKKLLGNDPSLWQTILSLLYLTVDIAIMGDFVPELVVLNDIFRHVRNSQSHLLVPGHRCFQVEIRDVHCHEFCIGCADDAIEEELDGE